MGGRDVDKFLPIHGTLQQLSTVGSWRGPGKTEIFPTRRFLEDKSKLNNERHIKYIKTNN
jgi:hypothetical protein